MPPGVATTNPANDLARNAKIHRYQAVYFFRAPNYFSNDLMRNAFGYFRFYRCLTKKLFWVTMLAATAFRHTIANVVSLCAKF